MASIRRELQKAILRGAFQGLQPIKGEAIANVSGKVLKRRTGLLASSFFTDVGVRRTPFAEIGVRGPAAIYGRIHEFSGAPPFFIRPRRKKALRFPVGQGLFAFSKGHLHPGLKKRPFLMPAVRKKLPQFKDRLAAETSEATAVVLTRGRK